MKSKKNKIIVFANQKGGVGKSTLCILLADYLTYWKKDVCIIDTDLQQSATLQREQDRQTFEEEEPYNLHISYSLKRKRLWLLRESVVRLFRFLDILALQKAFSSVSCALFLHSQALPSVKFGTTCQTVGGHTSHDRLIIP